HCVHHSFSSYILLTVSLSIAPPTPQLYTLSLHDALPILSSETFPLCVPAKYPSPRPEYFLPSPPYNPAPVLPARSCCGFRSRLCKEKAAVSTKSVPLFSSSSPIVSF